MNRLEEIIHALESYKTICSIPERIAELETILQNYENEQSDLLHFIEFAKADGKEMSKKYKELKLVRNERRKVKK